MGDAIAELRGRIESAALDHALDPAERLAKLDALDGELAPLLGELRRRRSDIQKLREADASEAVREVLWARENADLRVELIEMGEFTAGELDEMGMLSHDELDRLEEEGLLQEAVFGIARKWEEALHPRGRGGKWTDKLGGAAPSSHRLGPSPDQAKRVSSAAEKLEPRKEPSPVSRLRVGDRFEADGRGSGALTVHARRQGGVTAKDERGNPFDFEDHETVSRHVDHEGDRKAEHDERAVRALADYHAVRAERAESEITPVLQDAVASEGGELHGLDYRLKSRASIVSKIKRKRDTMPLATDEERAASITDLVRFTTTFDANGYNQGVERTLGALQDKGFAVDELENFWGGADDYDGLHVVMRHPDSGVAVELQFHTPESLEVKTGQLHPLYERFRDSQDAHERWDLWHQMVEATSKIPQPKGVEELGPVAPSSGARQRKAKGEDVPPAGALAQNHSDYFKGLDEPGVQEIPLDQLVPTKPPESQPDSVKVAQQRMADAKAGRAEKRGPISVRKRPDGKYDVEDGNATFGAAQAHGWSSLPAKEEAGGKRGGREPKPKPSREGRTAEAGVPVADGDTWDEVLAAMDAHAYSSSQFERPDLYKTHPKSGFPVRNELRATTVVNQPGEPPRVADRVPGRLGQDVIVDGSERPPDYLFRAVSEEDWRGIVERGELKSDQRMNLTDEGTVASLSGSLSFYLPGGLNSDAPGRHEGRLLRISYRDEDGWKLDTDGYVKTPKAIPFSRIELVSPKLVKTKDDRGFTGMPEVER